MEIKRFKNYITWRNKKGEFNTQCNRASLENDLALTIATAQVNMVGTYQYSKSDSFMKGKDRFNKDKDFADTIQTSQKEGIVNSDLRIRKLTPKEAMRLMGFDDSDYQALKDIGLSDQAIYHIAGDSIVVNVLEAIFRRLK